MNGLTSTSTAMMTAIITKTTPITNSTAPAATVPLSTTVLHDDWSTLVTAVMKQIMYYVISLIHALNN